VPAPLAIPPFSIVGAEFDGQRAFVEDEIRKACGGSLCVRIETEIDPSAPQESDCEVIRVDQEGELRPGDSITFVLNNPCDE
jgi:hypothetical protein